MEYKAVQGKANWNQRAWQERHHCLRRTHAGEVSGGSCRGWWEIEGLPNWKENRWWSLRNKPDLKAERGHVANMLLEDEEWAWAWSCSSPESHVWGLFLPQSSAGNKIT